MITGGFKKFIISATLAVFVFALGFSPQPAKAQWVVTDPGAAAIQGAKWGWEKGSAAIFDALLTAGKVALVNTAKNFFQKIAYDSAVYLGSGGSGQAPQLFTSDWDTYLEDAGKTALGDFADELGERWGVDFCAPIQGPTFQARIQLGILDDLGNTKGQTKGRTKERKPPECTFDELSNNFEGFIDRYDDTDSVLNEVSVLFEPGGNDLAVVYDIYGEALNDKDQKERAAEQERKTNKGFKDKSSKVAGNISTPGSFVAEEAFGLTPDKQNAKTQEEVASMSASESLEYILVNTGVVFLNTMAQTMLNKLTTDGLITLGQLVGSGGDSGGGDSLASKTASLSYGGREAAQRAYADLLTPRITQGGKLNLLNEFAACPGNFKQPNNCVVDQQFVLAVQSINQGEPLTIKQAMEKGLLHDDWKLYPPTHELNSGFNCFSSGYCYSNLTKLRRARIIPTGFEIAASLSPKQNPWQLGAVVRGFNECNVDGARDIDHPFCHLIDPDWVLKAPPMRCNAQAFGQTLTAPGVNTRNEVCVDVQDCPVTDESGNCVGAWGYCIAEKNTWNIGADQCPAEFASCEVYTDRKGKKAGYLATTVDHSICDASNVGCRRFLNSKMLNSETGELEWVDLEYEVDAQGVPVPLDFGEAFLGALVYGSYAQFVDTPAEIAQPPSPSYFFNEAGSAEQCAESDRGCTRVIREDGSELHAQIAPNYLHCYDVELGQSGVQLPVTIEQAIELAAREGCNEYAPVCAFEELGCQEYKPATGGSSITGIVSSGDSCANECVGYDTYKQEKTNFESAQFPLYLIPSSAQQCSFNALGCDEFTNLDVQSAGGEGLEYYTFVRTCEKPGINDPAFYTWEGTETDEGYQIQLHNLKAGLDGMPVYNTTDADMVAEFNAACHAGTYGVDPDCREIYNEAGEISYRLLSKTITLSEDCHPLRRSGATQSDCTAHGGAFTNGICIYQAVPSESTSCQAQFAGCRAYQGKSGADQDKVINEDFEGLIESPNDLGWGLGINSTASEDITISSEALLVGGHSLKIDTSVYTTRKVTFSQGATYSLSFWAKGSGAFKDIDVVAFGSGGSLKDLADDVPEGDRKLSTTWKRYTFGPFVIADNSVEAEFDGLIGFIGHQNMFIDNFELTQGDFHALIKDSWNTPSSCDADQTDTAPGAALGCELYTDTENNSSALKSFSNLCRPEAIGCENLIDTRNTIDEGVVQYNTSDENTKGDKNEDPNDNIIIGSDRLIRAVLTTDHLCSAAARGCTELGSTQIADGELTIESVYLINDPERYDTTLCEAVSQGCDAFTSKQGVSYFKDPTATGRLCEFRESAKIDGLSAAGGNTPSGWFKIGEEGDVPCSPSFLQSGNKFGIWKTTDPLYYTDNDNGAYTGMCESKYDQCFELIDHTDVDSKGKHKSYFVLDNKQIDKASCQGKVSREEGCVLFDDARNPNKSFSAGRAYEASEAAFGGFVNAADYPYFEDGIPAYQGIEINFEDGLVSETTTCDQELIEAIESGDEKQACELLFVQGVESNYCEFKPGTEELQFRVQPAGALGLTGKETADQYKNICFRKAAFADTVVKVKRDRQCSLWLSPNSFTTVPSAPAGRQKQVTGLGLCESVEKKKSGVVQCARWVNPEDDQDYGKVLNDAAYSSRGVEFTDREISGLWAGGMRAPYHYRVVTNKDKDDTMMAAAFSDSWLLEQGGDGCQGKNHWDDCGFSTDSWKCSEGSCIASLTGEDFGNGGAALSSCRGYPEETSPFSNSVVDYEQSTDPVSFKKQEYTSANICADGNSCACSYTKKTYANKTKTLYFDIGEAHVEGICQGGFYGSATTIDGKSKTGVACSGNTGEYCSDDRNTQKMITDAATGETAPDDPSLPLKVDGLCQAADVQIQNYRGWQGYCIETDGRFKIVDEKSSHACASWYPIDLASGGLDIYNQFQTAAYQPPGDYGRFWCAESEGTLTPTKNGTFDFDGDGALDSAFTYRSNLNDIHVNMTEEHFLNTSDKNLLTGNDAFRRQLDGLYVTVLQSDPTENSGIPVPGSEYLIGNDNVVRCYSSESDHFLNFCNNYFNSLDLGLDQGTDLKVYPPGDGNGNVGVVTFRDVNDHGVGGEERWLMVYVNDQIAKNGANMGHWLSKGSGNPYTAGKGHFATSNGWYDEISSYWDDETSQPCNILGEEGDSDSQAGAVMIRFGGEEDGKAFELDSTLCTDSPEGDGHDMSWTVSVDMLKNNQCIQTLQTVKLEKANAQDISYGFTQRLWQKQGQPGLSDSLFYDRDGAQLGGYKIPELGISYDEFNGPYGSMSLSVGSEPTSSDLPPTPMFLYSQSKDRQKTKGDITSELSADKLLEQAKFEFDGFSYACAGGLCGDKQFNAFLHPFKTATEGVTKGIGKLFAATFGVVENATATIPSDAKVFNDNRFTQGIPPVIASIDESQSVGNDGFKLRNMSAFNVNEIDGKSTAPKDQTVFGIGNMTANVRFAAWADTDQMPLKRMMVEWNDGTPKTGGSIAKYKNRKPYCGTTAEPVGYCGGESAPNVTCQSDNDCSIAGYTYSQCIFNELALGNDEDGCTEGFYEYQHVYAYSKGCGVGSQAVEKNIDSGVYPKHIVMSPGILNSPDYEFLKEYGMRVGDQLCIFKPKVQVQDNWGWCNGICEQKGSFGGCFSAVKQGQKIVDQCSGDVNQAWTLFAGEVIVVADDD